MVKKFLAREDRAGIGTRPENYPGDDLRSRPTVFFLRLHAFEDAVQVIEVKLIPPMLRVSLGRKAVSFSPGCVRPSGLPF